MERANSGNSKLTGHLRSFAPRAASRAHGRGVRGVEAQALAAQLVADGGVEQGDVPAFELDIFDRIPG